MAKPVALFVVGTRPDAIKSAPVVQEFQRHPHAAETVLVATGQHREMLAQALAPFGLKPDDDLDIMQHGQTLAQVTSRILERLDEVLDRRKPSIVFAQGDTTTTFVAGLAAFYRRIPFGHIEAGLRTDTVWDPFPEEFNRRAVSLFADLHFPPTQGSADNLLGEGVDPARIHVTGNTGIDAVKSMSGLRAQTWFPDHAGRIILLTTHRRENWGEAQERIARACLRLVEAFPDTLLVVPMHRNPTVRAAIEPVLQGNPRIRLIEPPDYPDFVKLTERCDLVLTDSGGIQEEAPTFGKPVLVLRETTERPEGVTAGTAKLVGTDMDVIFEEAARLLSSPEAYTAMAKATSPYGDGFAAQRIRYWSLIRFGIDSEEPTPWK